WPKACVKWLARKRAAASAPPPGGYGMITRTGLAGQACGNASGAASASSSASAARIAVRDMSSPLLRESLSHNHVSPMPPATLSLLAANIAAYLLSQGAPEVFALFALWPPGVPGAPSFEPWQLVTYGFLHGGLTHIFFNMFALYMFGQDIERLFGT